MAYCSGFERSIAVFKIGDNVVLASGGPVLKVIGVSPNGLILCEWKIAGGVIEEASFPPAMLQLAT
jgi:uncharacterized protein YodC (DUF2158 family)